VSGAASADFGPRRIGQIAVPVRDLYEYVAHFASGRLQYIAYVRTEP
jgi:hypothetical protein